MTTDDVTFLSAENLSSCPNIRHAFYTRTGGVSGGIYASLNVGIGSQDDRNNVVENRRRAMAALDMPANALHTLYQVHGADVVRIDSGEAWQVGSAPQADAMVSSRPGAVLGVLTADCVPVLFADSSAGVVGAAHSGWKGTLVGVLEAPPADMLSSEKALLRRWVGEQDRPFLGICLGHQMLAAALGGTVGPMPPGEVGLDRVRLTEAGRRDPLLAGQPAEMAVFQWHTAGVQALPAGAARPCKLPRSIP